MKQFLSDHSDLLDAKNKFLKPTYFYSFSFTGTELNFKNAEDNACFLA